MWLSESEHMQAVMNKVAQREYPIRRGVHARQRGEVAFATMCSDVSKPKTRVLGHEEDRPLIGETGNSFIGEMERPGWFAHQTSSPVSHRQDSNF
jgi:hypothetical protein